MNATEYASKIDPKVLDRLTRGIEALFKARRDTVQIAETLSKQESFGKYDGCHRAAILSIANDVGRKINAKIREDNRFLASQIRKSAIANGLRR